MALRRYIIERDIPKVGTLEREQLREAAKTSNSALAQLAPDIQWVEIVRRRQQDLLCLPREGRGGDRPACRDQRISGHQDHRGAQDHRSHDRASLRRVTSARRPRARTPGAALPPHRGAAAAPTGACGQGPTGSSAAGASPVRCDRGSRTPRCVSSAGRRRASWPMRSGDRRARAPLRPLAGAVARSSPIPTPAACRGSRPRATGRARQASTRPQFMPWPPAGLCTCAASPIRNRRSLRYDDASR